MIIAALNIIDYVRLCRAELGARVAWGWGARALSQPKRALTETLQPEPVNQSTSEPPEPVNHRNQWTSEPVNQWTSEPVNQWTSEQVNQWTSEPTEPVNHLNQRTTTTGEPPVL